MSASLHPLVRKATLMAMAYPRNLNDPQWNAAAASGREAARQMVDEIRSGRAPEIALFCLLAVTSQAEPGHATGLCKYFVDLAKGAPNARD